MGHGCPRMPVGTTLPAQHVSGTCQSRRQGQEVFRRLSETPSASLRPQNAARKENSRVERVRLAVELRSIVQTRRAITLKGTLTADEQSLRITQRSATPATTSFIREMDNDRRRAGTER